MNQKFKVAICRILSFVNTIIPKQKRVFINGGNRLYDNNEAMFEYLLKNSEYKIICVANQHRHFQLRKGVKIVKDSYIAEIYYLMTSRVVIDSFLRAFKIKPCGRQISIQLWHGTPFKFGAFDENDPLSDYYTHIACPSTNYINIVKKLFCSDGSNIIINGNPRNDYLFDPFLGSLKKDKGERYIAWLPTYRHGLKREESNTDLPVLNRNNIVELNNCLKENNVTLFIKPHPFQSKSFESIIDNKSNIILINDQMLSNDGIVLYRFLGGMDALLTDYSSVFYDFLLLDKPIGFVIEDIEEYHNGRGFMFDDPISMMPGMKIYNIEDLKKFVSTFYCNDDYTDERKKMNDFANRYRDNQNCARIMKLISNTL